MSTVILNNKNSSKLEVSPIGFGCMGVTAFYGDPLPDDAAFQLFKEVYEMGYKHFDTAEAYRTGLVPTPNMPKETVYNEKVLGNFLKTLKPGTFTVATKYAPMMHGNKSDLETVEKAVDDSLERLQVPSIDLYYCHRMPGSVEGLEQWMHSIKVCVEKGKVKHVGLSEVAPEWLRRAHAIHPITAVQQEWSLFSRDLEDSVVPTCAELGIGIVAYSPLARNLLATPKPPEEHDWRVKEQPRFSKDNFEKNAELVKSITALAEAKGKSAAQLSLAWLYAKAKQLKVTVVPIPGTTKAAHAKDNFGGVGVELSAEEAKTLEELGASVAGLRGSESYMKSTFQSQM